MPRKLKWTDAEEIAIRLFEAHPNVNPLDLRFTDLHARVCALPDFDDDPEASNEARLEAIQMAWLEEFNEANA